VSRGWPEPARRRGRSTPASHGTRYAYLYDRCRCPDCTAANTAYQAQRTRTRQLLLAEGAEVTHGTRATYTNWGCRCPACVAANTARSASYRRKRAVS
jgi:rubredoxin